MTDIIAIKNELNNIVNLRKETLAKIDTQKERIEDIGHELNKLRTNPSPNELSIRDVEIQLEQAKTIAHSLEINLENHVYLMDDILTKPQSQLFSALIDVCKTFSNEAIKTPKQETVALSFISLDYISFTQKAIQFNANKSTLIIYPNIVLVQDAENSFYIVPTSSLQLSFTKNNISKEAEVQPQVKHELRLTIPTMYDETFLFNDEPSFTAFEKAYSEYVQLVNNIESAPLQGIKRTYFDRVQQFGKQFLAFINAQIADENFKTLVLNNKPSWRNETFEKNIATVAFVDLLKCMNNVSSNKNTSSNESFAMMYMERTLSKLPINTYEQITELNNKASITHYTDLVQSLTHELAQQPVQFELSQIYKTYKPELCEQYNAHLYQFARLIIEADGKTTRSEEDALHKLFSQTDAKTVDKLQQASIIIEQEKTLDELLYDLYDLTGLQTVKREINTLINVIKIKKAREDFNLKNTDMSLHIVFSGNPGTGKTTVARHLAKLYKCLGVLKKGHLVETDRSGLIAEYVGQTAIKVNKLVDSALDGVLFIDEAYAILTDEKDTYGKEAIATLLKRMEDNRDRLIVVLAGYTMEMQSFIESNPGLKSRFNKYIFFPDYTPDQLYSIFIGMSRKLNFTLEPKLVDLLKLRFLEEIEKGDPSFGNGRFVRNLFEQMLENQANRLAFEEDLSKEKLTLLREVDLPI